MAIKILNTGNSGGSSSSSSNSDDIIGELTTGYGQVPDYEDLGTFAIRSDDPEVAEAVAAFFGGQEIEYEESPKRPYYAVLPEEFSVPITVELIRTSMLLRSRKGKTLRKCDGETMVSLEDGKPAGPCQGAMAYEHGSAEFREAAKDGLACKPDGLIFFTIPGLALPGKFIFSKSSWTTVPAFVDLEEEADAIGVTRFSTEVGLKYITSKKTGYSWNIPTFTDPKEID